MYRPRYVDPFTSAYLLPIEERTCRRLGGHVPYLCLSMGWPVDYSDFHMYAESQREEFFVSHSLAASATSKDMLLGTAVPTGRRPDAHGWYYHDPTYFIYCHLVEQKMNLPVQAAL